MLSIPILPISEGKLSFVSILFPVHVCTNHFLYITISIETPPLPCGLNDLSWRVFTQCAAVPKRHLICGCLFDEWCPGVDWFSALKHLCHMKLWLGHQRLAKPKLQNNLQLNVFYLNPHQRLGFSILNYQHVTPSMTVISHNSVLQHVIQAVLAYFCIFGSWPQGRAIVAVTPRLSFPEQIKWNVTLKRHAKWIVRACVIK